ncbi:hypothetical protein [Streptomyces sp. NPDC002573]|uniref:hypothetical protein n=1 Tax=Streptomyces sp. NPDC002573 TaxID=3364651 RepID=UPI00369903BA
MVALIRPPKVTRPTELFELHRRWILADAARRREPGPTTGAGAAGATAARAAGAPVPAADALDAVDSETAVPDHESVPAGESGPEATRVLWFRRRRVLVGAVAVAVAAVAVPTAVLAATYSAPPARHRLADAADRTGAPASHGGGTSAGAATGASSPAAAASTDGSHHPSPATTTTPRPSRPVSSAPAAPPFHVNVLTNNWDSPCDQWFLLNRAPGAVPPPPASQATDGWAAALGAVPAGHLRLQVTVQGSSSRPVVLHALFVRVTGTRTAPAGNAYTMGAGCGGDLAPASFAVDLDAQAPSPKAVPGHEGNVLTRATDFPYKVSVDDPEVLNRRRDGRAGRGLVSGAELKQRRPPGHDPDRRPRQTVPHGGHARGQEVLVQRERHERLDPVPVAPGPYPAGC